MSAIKIKNDGEKNYTPKVISALLSLGSEGGTLEFEKGEYHFYKGGSLDKFIAVSNNSACIKHIVFPILGMKNITIDGAGSEFIFHDITFPFAVQQSEGVVLKNFSVDTGIAPTGVFNIGKICEDGFYLQIDEKKTPYVIENGMLSFMREGYVRTGEKLYSLHAVKRRGVQYLLTGECKSSAENLPAPHMLTNAEKREDGIFIRYKAKNPYPVMFSEGELVCTLLDGGRDTDVILLDSSRDILIKDVTVRRGIGMGVIAQLSENIEINGLKTDSAYHGGDATLSADSMHFVNCSGNLEIHNCKITHTMDDAINVHGMYTRVCDVSDGKTVVSIGHREQYYFSPYKVRDVLDVLDEDSFNYMGRIKVKGISISDSGKEITLETELVSGEIRKGYLVENAQRMPNVHIHDNQFHNYPNLRISGNGDILIENNSFSRSTSALIAKDLAKYWYESGRIRNLIFRNNLLDGCNDLGGQSFITIDVDGVNHTDTPKIHDRIEISNNTFKNLKSKAITAAGVKDLVIKDNLIENADGAIIIDGEKAKI